MTNVNNKEQQVLQIAKIGDIIALTIFSVGAAAHFAVVSEVYLEGEKYRYKFIQQKDKTAIHECDNEDMLVYKLYYMTWNPSDCFKLLSLKEENV